MPAISDTVNFAPDLDGYYCNNKATFIPDLVLFSCAISEFPGFAWYASKTFATKEGGFFDFEPRYSSQLIVPHATRDQQQVIQCVANYVIRNQSESTAAAYFERLLNGMVYELFFPDDLHAQKLRFFDILER